jgi:type IV pilus assembly protein PilM
MARRAVGVERGSRYVKVAELVREGSGVRAVRCAAQEIADSSDAAKTQAVIRAMHSAGIRGRKAVCGLARADAVMKCIRLPSTDRDAIRKMLEFEAQQHVPFPLEEMDWDFDSEGDGLVVLVAARKASLDAARRVLAQAGLALTAVSVSSAAAALAYLQEAGDPAVEKGEETSVLIELGAGPVIVNVFRGRAWLLSRPLRLSGGDLAAAFAADLGCDIGQAQRTMQSQGMAAVPAGGTRVGEWIQLLRTEIERSLLAASEQTTTLTVERVAATGGGWIAPGLAQAVSKALGMPVEVFPTGPEPVTPAFGAAIGLGLQGLGLARGINLLSSAAVGARRQASRWVSSAVAGVALLAALSLGTWRYWTIQQRSLALQPVRAAAARRQADMESLRARQHNLDARLAEVQALLKPRHKVLNALRELSARAPAGVWLTSVSYAPGRPVTADGKATSAAQVTDLLEALGSRAALAYVKQGEKDVSFSITMQVDEGG